MTVRHVLSGMAIETDVPLVGVPEARGTGPADLVVVRAGERSVPGSIAAGRPLQSATWGGELRYSTVELDGGDILLRLHGLVDFCMSADLRTVRAVTDPRCTAEMLGILIGGNLLATVLALRGETVLHASTVEVDGRAVAFVAHSGGGKSTLATLASAAGARFVTDDLLRTFVDDEGVLRCWPGSPESRLRRSLADLVDVPGAGTRRSVDGRVVWCPEPTTHAAPVLAAVVLPAVARGTAAVRVSQIPQGTALVELARRPRILGVVDPALRTREFANLARLVRAVPVHLAHVPWGPPFDPAVTEDLLALAGVPLTARCTRMPAS